MELHSRTIQSFRRKIFYFYKVHGRHDLVWRHIDDPYAVLVSEVMLQQTQVGRVMEKFPQFLSRFPDFLTLAHAPVADVLREWQGMGYNRRALSLQKSAQLVVSEHGGVLPCDPDVLLSFPGIGPATSRSVCAFAFNSPVVFIETNIRRVYIHHFFDANEVVSDDAIFPFVESTLPRRRARDWYNALMDYGTHLAATVPNPNRRSKHYAKQSTFEGSNRQVRGALLKFLSSYSSCALSVLCSELPFDDVVIRKNIAALEKEGFLVLQNGNVTLA